MDGEKKRGWWALIAMAVPVATLMGYVGAYCAMVKPSPVRTGPGARHHFVVANYPSVWMYPVFKPIHQIDRRLRPKVWDIPEFPP